MFPRNVNIHSLTMLQKLPVEHATLSFSCFVSAAPFFWKSQHRLPRKCSDAPGVGTSNSLSHASVAAPRYCFTYLCQLHFQCLAVSICNCLQANALQNLNGPHFLGMVLLLILFVVHFKFTSSLLHLCVVLRMFQTCLTCAMRTEHPFSFDGQRDSFASHPLKKWTAPSATADHQFQVLGPSSCLSCSEVVRPSPRFSLSRVLGSPPWLLVSF